MKNKVLAFVLLSICATVCFAQKYKSYEGLVMAGYQGWFNTPADGAGRGWHHYGGKEGFKPGSASVDLWPDTSEYPVLYKTEFQYADGTPAYTFSSYDASTVDVHFRWMKEYGIDGVFMQRFIVEIKNPKGKNHFDKVLQSAMASSQLHERAISIMYDLSGMSQGDEEILLKDIDELEKRYNWKETTANHTFLYHNKKPLIAIWGIGFNDNRKYGLNEARKIIEGLKKRGYSILIGVPTYWRELKSDTEPNEGLHKLIRQCDIVLPWLVGRYDEAGYETYKHNIKKDMEWCANNQLDYVPLCYPGFSWKNMKGNDSFYVARNAGSFLWKQYYSAIQYGAGMLYVAMFDEIDEGTAIFKCARKDQTPKGAGSVFEGIEPHLPTDYYLWLTGEAGRMLRKERSLSPIIPQRETK